MTRLAPLWQQNSSYPASTDRTLIGTIWPTSGSSGGAPALVAGTMNVTVAAGTAAVALSGSNYSALCRWDAAETVTLAAGPPAGQTRIDLVVLQVRDAAIDAGTNNDFIFQAITGTPSSGTPAAPAVPANAYPVCQVTVPAGAANLNGATIADRRTPTLVARDKLQVKMYRTSGMTIGTAQTNIPMEVVVYDPSSMNAGGLVAPAAGIWQASGCVTVATGPTYIFGVICRNGTPVLETNAYGPAGTAYLSAAMSGPVQLAAGDVVTLQATAQAAVAVATGLLNTWQALSYLGSG